MSLKPWTPSVWSSQQLEKILPDPSPEWWEGFVHTTLGTIKPKEREKMQVIYQVPQAGGSWSSKPYRALGVQAVMAGLWEDPEHFLKFVVHLLDLLTQGVASDATELQLLQAVEVQGGLQKVLQGRFTRGKIMIMMTTTVGNAHIRMGTARLYGRDGLLRKMWSLVRVVTVWLDRLNINSLVKFDDKAERKYR